ncbi:hypothetical protein ACFYN5_34960 [Streptomyces sp. NPDC007126]|uniref:hypothetical protein n=1 Tax=Streptomyces sp. NPDC007126 TaxID=3364774 RepID=UPI0036840C1E
MLQQFGEGGSGPRGIPRLSSPVGEMGPGGEGVGVVRAEVGRDAVGEVLVVVPGGGDLAGFAEAAAGAIQHRMRVGPVQHLFGVAGENGGVGAQGLRKGGVAFDLGPGGQQSVGGGAGELSVLVGSEDVSGGALDELVDTDGPVGCAGGVVDETEPVQGA